VLGFLHATIEDQKKTRAERLGDDFCAAIFPNVHDNYIWKIASDGCLQSQMTFDRSHITWPELNAIAQLHSLNTDEAALIRNMSKAYVKYLSVGESPFGIPPWESDE
jgi:hypothetical protein